MLLSTITGFIFNPTPVTVLGLIRIILSYAVTLLPVMVLALVIVFFANIFRSGVAVFFLSIILFIVFKALEIVYSQYSSFFITTTLDWFHLWNMDSLPMLKLLREFLIMSGCAIMFFTAGFYLFDKKDL
jgi:ABC-2 type transport system permease protein